MNTLPRRIIAAGSTARLATEGTGLAMIMLSLARTGGVGRAGVLLACATLPQLLTGPLIGARLDRSRRPHVVVAGAVGATVVALLVMALDRQLGAPSVGAALVVATTTPALGGGLSATFSRLVPPGGHAGRIPAWDSLTYNAAGLAAPALVAAATALAGATVATLALAGLVAVAVPALLTWPASTIAPKPAEPPSGHRQSDGVPGLLAQVAAAGRLTLRRPELRSVTITTTVAFIGIGGLGIAAAAAARDAGLGGEAAGQLMTAIAIGALAGSLLWTRLAPSTHPDRTVWIATAATGALLVLMGVAPWPLTLAGAALVGLLDAPILICTFAARNRNSPSDQRSAVFTVGSSAKLATSSVGALAAGHWLDTAATSTGLLAVGIVSLAAAALGRWAAGKDARADPGAVIAANEVHDEGRFATHSPSTVRRRRPPGGTP